VTFAEIAEQLKEQKMDKTTLKNQVHALCMLLEEKGCSLQRCEYCKWCMQEGDMKSYRCGLCHGDIDAICDDCLDPMFHAHYDCYICRKCIDKKLGENSEEKLSECLVRCACCLEEVLVVEEKPDELMACDACHQPLVFRCAGCSANATVTDPVMCDPCGRKESKKQRALKKTELVSDRPQKKSKITV